MRQLDEYLCTMRVFRGLKFDSSGLSLAVAKRAKAGLIIHSELNINFLNVNMAAATAQSV
jgi:hypothetical protein